MMSIGNISARNVQGRPRIAPEDVAQFLAGGAAYETPGAEPRIRAPWSDPNAPMDPLVVQTPARRRLGAFGRATNAPSSGGASTDDAYRLFRVLERVAQGDGALRGASTDDAYRLFCVPEPHGTADALAALAEVDDEIAEENLPPVSDATKAEAERIVKALARRAPAPTVYPTQDAEIALHFKAPGRTGTVVILLSDGVRADCHAYVGGTSRRAHYDTSSDLPDAFVLDQLRRLMPPTRAAVSMQQVVNYSMVMWMAAHAPPTRAAVSTPNASSSLFRTMFLQTICP